MTIQRIDGQPDWDSELNDRAADQDGCVPLKLKIKAFCLAQPPGGYSFQAIINGEGGEPPRREWKWMEISDYGPAEVDAFKENFESCINTRFRDKLWLIHSGARTGCFGGVPLTFQNVKCELNVRFVDRRDDAQMVVQMFYEPTGSGAHLFRQNCALGGRARMWGPVRWLGMGDNPVDMQICNDDHVDVTWSFPTSHGDQSFTQCVLLHEFGHYLGLDHRCASSGAAGSDAQYCIGGSSHLMRDLMAVGNDIRGRHARPWVERVSLHGYSPGSFRVSWNGTTTRPRVPTPSEYPRECRPE